MPNLRCLNLFLVFHSILFVISFCYCTHNNYRCHKCIPVYHFHVHDIYSVTNFALFSIATILHSGMQFSFIGPTLGLVTTSACFLFFVSGALFIWNQNIVVLLNLITIQPIHVWFKSSSQFPLVTTRVLLCWS